MKNIIGILLVFGLIGCQDVTIGFLNTGEAGYEIDSLEVKLVLDNTVPDIIPNPEYEEYIDMGFNPESCIEMGIYPTLEIGGGEDYTRDKYSIPWTSTPIEGVDGTAPIYVSIKDVTSRDGDSEKMKAVLTVKGDGMLSVPCHHNVPLGRYIVSLTFPNEGYTRDVDACFTIIVK